MKNPMFRRAVPPHPVWCAGSHRCTASWTVAGEHRSAPLPIRVGAHRLVVTLTQAPGAHLITEVRLNVALTSGDGPAVSRQVAALLDSLTGALAGAR